MSVKSCEDAALASFSSVNEENRREAEDLRQPHQNEGNCREAVLRSAHLEQNLDGSLTSEQLIRKTILQIAGVDCITS